LNESLAPALRRVITVVSLGVLPVAALIGMLVVGVRSDSLSADFHHELYPQAKLLLDGVNPFPDPSWNPLAAPNFIWPPLAGYLVAPLTVLPPGAADVVIALLGLAALVLSLWLVGVREWRVYGVFCLWPEVVGEMRVAHLTPVLALGAAVAWRTRGTHGAPGLAIGLATSVKFLLWPLVVWLAATRRTRDALVAAAVVGASLLLVLPYTGLDAYLRSLLRLGRAFDQDGYTVFGMLVQAGAPESAARAAMLLVGGALLLATWRYRSFTLAIAAALALSPIVWLDYFALAAIPLAIHRPRLSWVWFAPLATWGLEGAGLGIGDFWHSARLLGVFAVVLGVAFAAERSAEAAEPEAPGRARTRANATGRFRRSSTA
jgi:arabinofuranan 3-O-arabinosyltransferase